MQTILNLLGIKLNVWNSCLTTIRIYFELTDFSQNKFIVEITIADLVPACFVRHFYLTLTIFSTLYSICIICQVC